MVERSAVEMVAYALEMDVRIVIPRSFELDHVEVAPKQPVTTTLARMVRELPVRSLEDRRTDERYQRLMEATRRAARSGYDAVSMRELAKETRMSMTTIYQYCSSKDHLIAEAHLEWMERFRAGLEAKPPRGRTARARVLAYVKEIVSAWEQQEVLIRTLQRAVYSMDPGVAEVRSSMGGTYSRIMELAIGDDSVSDPKEVAEIIGHVIDSVTFRWVSGTVGNDEGRKILERAVRTLLPAQPLHSRSATASRSPARTRRVGSGHDS